MQIQSSSKGGQSLLSGTARDSGLVIEFPLQKISYEIIICDGLAQINQKHTYKNTSNQFMELQFQLPINPETCLHKFVASFAGKRIEGVIKEKEEAREEYAEAVSDGKMAAIGQINKERDIMNIQIGNIPPNSDIFLQFSCIQELTLTLNTFYCFDLKTRMNPKCLDKISSQNMLKAFRKAHNTMIGSFSWDFSLQLRSTRKIITARSTTHSLKLQNHNDANTRLSFTFDKDTLDHDFSFIYTTQDFQLPSFSVGRNDLNTSVMVSFIPKFCHLSLGDAQNAAMANNKKLEMDIKDAKGQYIFLLDRSGSMQGHNIRNAKNALVLFIKSLPLDSYFNVVSFGSNFQYIFNRSLKNNNDAIKQALDKINRMDADFGGTNIYEPLQSLFSGQVIEGYPKQIFLLTDGEVRDADKVIQLVRRKAKHSRVHGIGIGAGASRHLIKECSKKGKGSYTFIAHNENAALKIVKLLNDSLSAVVSQVQLDFDERLVQSIVPNPKSIPYVLKGEIINFFITFKGHLTEKTRVSLAYKDSMNNLSYKASTVIDPQTESFAFIDKMGHFKTIKALQDSYSEQGKLQDRIYYVKQIDTKKQIIDLSIKSQVLSTFTSFLCVEKNIVDGRKQQINDKGKVRINIQQKSVQRAIPKSYVPIMAQPNYAFSVPRSGVGKGGHGVGGKGKVGTMRTSMKRYARSSIEGITKGAIRRLARKGGVKRLSSFIYDDARLAIRSFLQSLIKNTIIYCECARRKTVSALDVIYALKTLNRNIYLGQPSSSTKNKLIENPLNFFKSKPIRKPRTLNKKSRQLAQKRRMKDLIDMIVENQDAEGFWSDQSLLTKILSQADVSKINWKDDSALITTIIIIRWLEINIPNEQYILLIKKAKNWIDKHPKHKQYQSRYSSIIK